MSSKRRSIKSKASRMEFSTLTMKDFGNVMRHLKVFGNSVLDEKKKFFKELFYLQLHLLMLKKMNSV